MKKIFMSALLIAGVVGFCAQAHAALFEYIRIGDVDGFGYGSGSGYTAANGGAANVGPGGMLYGGDYLPDLNNDGILATGSGDDFDNRDAAEVGDVKFSAVGASVNTAAMAGSDFTDIALSTSYGSSQAANKVWNHPADAYGSGGPFPAPPTSVPNQPGFVFDFSVAASDILFGTDVYFNMLFADYDVWPANIKITSHDGSIKTLGITLQNNATDDGLIQTAFSTLAFNDVFWGVDALGNHLGYLKVDFVANKEPYTAFDFVELSVDPISPDPIPEPGSILLLGTGILGLAVALKKLKN